MLILGLVEVPYCSPGTTLALLQSGQRYTVRVAVHPPEMSRPAHLPGGFRAALEDMARCVKHSFDAAVTTCRDCRHDFCSDCVLDVPRLGTLCVPCALTRSGVRRRRIA
jgi:hypothetical protein